MKCTNCERTMIRAKRKIFYQKYYSKQYCNYCTKCGQLQDDVYQVVWKGKKIQHRDAWLIELKRQVKAGSLRSGVDTSKLVNRLGVNIY